jgi:hypothetical protein
VRWYCQLNGCAADSSVLDDFAHAAAVANAIGRLDHLLPRRDEIPRSGADWAARFCRSFKIGDPTPPARLPAIAEGGFGLPQVATENATALLSPHSGRV